MSKFWSELVKQVEPYVPGEQPQQKVIKLNTNENPYPPSPNVLQAIKDAVNDDLRLYPTPTVDDLRETIGSYYGVNKNQVFIGNGSDEVLAFSFMAFFNPGETILFPDITYSFYPVYASLFNIAYKEVPVRDDFTIPIEQFFHAEGGVIFPNPNAPTGIGLTLEKIERMLEHNTEKVVIVDEAYVDFGCETAVKLVERYPNLLVIQTLSKSRALAGMRVGFAIGNELLIEGLNRIKNSFNSYTIDRLALAAANQAFLDEAYFQHIRSKIINTRENTRKQLTELGFNVLPSATNFLFIQHREIDAETIYTKLKEQNIYVRHFNKPKIKNYIRLTIGTEEEMNQFFTVIKTIFNR